MSNRKSQFWYEEHGVVSIGAQCGGPEDGGLGDIKVHLYKSFLRNCHKSYSDTVRHFALALRIEGKFRGFGKEGIEGVRRNNRESYIGADIVIPSAVWKGKAPNELRDYLASQVNAALNRCLMRLEKDKVRIDSASLRSDFERAIEQFKQMDFELDRN